MQAPRPFALMRTRDQWARASHAGTEIDADNGGVELARIPPEPSAAGGPPAGAAGLAFDHECRLYRSIPAEGRVVRQLWAAVDPLGPAASEPEPIDLLEGPAGPAGDFAPVPPGPPPLLTPRGLAVDCNDYLFVAETEAGRVLVYDLWNRRLLRRIGFAAPPGATARPLDLAAAEEDVLCVVDDGRLFRVTARGEPVELSLLRPVAAPPDAEAKRVAVAPGGAVAVLLVDSTGRGWIAPLSGPAVFPPVDDATDLEFAADDSLVVACAPGEDFTRFRIDGDAVIGDAPLKGRNYDGSAIVRTPDGQIAFWTDRGLRHAVVARADFVTDGQVTTYRLDSGEYHTDWGRLFLDACIPGGCDVSVFYATADDVSDEPTIARTPPPNVDAPIVRPDLSPPMLPISLAPADDSVWYPLHRRETGREVPWARFASDDPFETYESPVNAPPGRYLWVTLDLHGTGHATPQIRSLRAEHPSHDLLRRLPKTYSRDANVASFLRRYLAVFDGTLGDLEARADARDVLLDPQATPEEALPWLASFLGLALDERWPLPARRELIVEVPQLWRERGTVTGLSRFLELYLGRPPVLVEHYRLRGLGGALLADESSSLFAGAVVGTNFRVGGAVGEPGEQPLTGDTQSAFTTHAHRFTVLVPALLDADGFDVVRDVLQAQRPAHTIVDVCTVASGMRVGYGLHVGLLSVIGRSGGFKTIQLGASRVGRTDIVGRPAPGAKLGIDQPGPGMRVG
jgi:phage tail-like protein